MQDETTPKPEDKECPVNKKALERPSCMATVPGIKYCDVCGKAMCPICERHSVQQISRVTGYVGAVSGFNEGKKQELRDRKRYDIGGR
ncbi:MAG: anaerobic ribonucleoside-triphosphate reductase [Anaerolineales bacterium]|nr:anaerobic ribonucleoside-triphosphate reductase [Anaerolineales bacterium]